MNRLVLVLCGITLPALAAPPPTGPVAAGIFRGRPVIYQTIRGRPVFEGDIILDHVLANPGGSGGRSVGASYSQYLWPEVGGVATIPYIITNAPAALQAAIAQFNATFSGVVQLVPWTNQTDYVNFDFNTNDESGQCESNVGRAGGEQAVTGSIDCALGTLLHELGHVVGLYHEQSRSDRNTYITFNYASVIKGSIENFTQLADEAENLTAYDYASIMSYVPYAFTRNGGDVLESIPPGIPLSNTQGYTPADIDGIKRLYGVAPTQVTVASNPPGLSVTVDGNAVTAPQAFTWKMGTTHTLSVPSTAQSLNGAGYIFGRWSNTAAASQSIKITAGNGAVGFPKTSPQVTTYTANFVSLSPYTAVASPTASGSVNVSPAPSTYDGLAGSYFVSRQSVTLTPAPAAGYAFLTWGGTSAPWGANPKTMPVPDLGAPLSVTAYMTTKPITTITTTPPGLGFQVDGDYWYGPQNFASDFFPKWTPGSKHKLASWTPQQPYSVNTRFVWKTWSDGGTLTHTIVVPAGASTITGTYSAQYVPVAWQTPGCASTIALSPTSPTGFYTPQQTVKFTSATASGWVFDGWLYDLSGRTDPKSLPITDEELVVANYDTSLTPLKVSSLSPSFMLAGSAGGNVRILGAGFTSGSIVFVNNIYRGSTYVGPAEIDVAVTSSDVAGLANIPVGVSNFPSGAPCSSYAAATFQVRQ